MVDRSGGFEVVGTAQLNRVVDRGRKARDGANHQGQVDPAAGKLASPGGSHEQYDGQEKKGAEAGHQEAKNESCGVLHDTRQFLLGRTSHQVGHCLTGILAFKKAGVHLFGDRH